MRHTSFPRITPGAARPRRAFGLGLAALLALLLCTSAEVSAAPIIDVLTLGASEDVFELFGHAALCVTSDAHPQGVCYNYGTADFRRSELGWEVMRSEATFWVERVSYERVLRSYRRQDRTIYRQRLNLPAAQAEALAEALDHDALPENRNYLYDHFFDNCTTRLRDRLDLATNGRLSEGASAPSGTTFRELVRRGFASTPEVLDLSELTLGRVLDREATVWDAMFLPDVFRRQVEARYGVAPEVVYLRSKGEPTHEHDGPRYQMMAVLIGLGALLGAAGALGASRGHRWPVAIAGVLLGLLAVPVWLLASASPSPELRFNELLLLLTPLDFALVGFSRQSTQTWLKVRLGMAALLALGALLGLAVQPVLPFLLLVLAAFGPPALITWRLGLKPATTASTGSAP